VRSPSPVPAWQKYAAALAIITALLAARIYASALAVVECAAGEEAWVGVLLDSGCTPLPCPPYSAGKSVAAGCKVITQLQVNLVPVFSLDSMYLGWPKIPSNILPNLRLRLRQCEAGCSGRIQPSETTPFYSGECTPVGCPKDSVGNSPYYVGNVGKYLGCQCDAGYRGSIKPTRTSPFYAGGCAAAACPAGSAGEDVPRGCTCDPGHAGAIAASKREPFFSGACELLDCPPHSERSTSGANPSGCSCAKGCSGGITATRTQPHYSGACVPVSCPPRSSGTNVLGGCVCDDGYTGSNGTFGIIPTFERPYYVGDCRGSSHPFSCAYEYALGLWHNRKITAEGFRAA
jgi:hypothetical protein